MRDAEYPEGTYEVTLNIDQSLTFLVEDAADPAEAIRRAVEDWRNGEPPQEDGWPIHSLGMVKVGDRKVHFIQTLDYTGPRDERGLLRYKHHAKDWATGASLASGYDLDAVAIAAIDALDASGALQ